MKEIKDFQLIEGDEKLGVRISSSSQQITLPGCSVERIFDLPKFGYLCLTTNDSPFEETLYIVLTDASAVIIDQIELYKPYTPGVVKDVSVQDENTIVFEFWEGTVHQLSVDDDKKIRFSRFLPQDGCHYLNKFSSSYLTISK